MTSHHERALRMGVSGDGVPATLQDASLGALIKSLGADTSTLIRQEAALLKAEAREVGGRLQQDAMRIGLAAGLAFVGVLALAAFLIIALGLLFGGMYWFSALLVGVVGVLTGWIMTRSAIARMRTGALAPAETLESLKESASFVKREMAELKDDITNKHPAPARR
jgi:hypothetical protein